MAYTFTLSSSNQMAGVGSPSIWTATSDTTAAAGANGSIINCGFVPRAVRVLDSTNALIYEWNAGMASASVFKHFASGTTLTSYAASNGITPVLPSAGNQAGVTIGSGLHTNSSTYSIELWP